MKPVKSFTLSNEAVEKLEYLLNYYNSLNLPFNYSNVIEYLINNEYTNIIAIKKSIKK